VDAPLVADDLAVAVEAARAGGRVLREGRGGEAQAKEDRTSIVTATDLASQAVIVATIRAARPDDAVIGEEGVDGDPSAERAWIVDPLDGTTNFAHGFPFSCVSVAVREGGEIIAAAVYAPAFDEVFAARRGGGATLAGTRISSSTTSGLGRALVATGLQSADPDRIASHAERVRRLHASARGVRMPGSPALSLCHVACGRLDAFLEDGLQPWDVAAGLLVLVEAGGRVTDFDGALLALDGPAQVLASNGSLHPALSALLE
jgi:myo-inositol-1(or 4)-monophosphatase